MEQKDELAGVKNLKIKFSEMVSISQFCKNPPRYIHQVSGCENRVILVKNGVPIAAIISLDLLADLDSDEKKN